MEKTKGFEAVFIKDKETKNTIRYNEVEKDGWQRVGYVYIQKAAIAQAGLGDKITITVQPAE